MFRLLMVALVGAVSVGCASTSTMGLARTLNQGAVQGWVGLQGGGIVATGSSPGAASTGVGYPMVEGGVRVGASDHVELGAKLGFNGIGLEGKFALLRSPTMDRGFNFSLNPQVGFFGIGVAGAFVGNLSFQLPLLFGIDIGGHELIIGPKLHDQVLFGSVATNGATSGAAVNILSGGLSLGFAIKAGPVRILPEASFVAPFHATASVTNGGTASGTGVGGFIFQFGIGLLFGSAESYERKEAPPVIEQTPPAPQPMPYPVQPLPPAQGPVGEPVPVEALPPPPPPPPPSP